jgi:hypothetical protein
MSKLTFEGFTKTNLPNSWVTEGTLQLYVRRNPFTGDNWGHIDFDIANMINRYPGKGDLKRFLDKWEPVHSFFFENVLNPQLGSFLIRRGYVVMQSRTQDLGNGELVNCYHKIPEDETLNAKECAA